MGKNLENVLILHTNDYKYYSFTVEGLSKLALALQHPTLSKIPNLRILVDPQAPFVLEYFTLFGITNMLEFYNHDKYQYQIENIYTIDWTLDEMKQKTVSFIEDYSIPPTAVLQYARSILKSKFPVPEKPRNVILYVNRVSTIRRFWDLKALFNRFETIANENNMEFMVHNGNETLSEQVMMFSQDKTVIIELPVSPEKTSEYLRMASIFNFPYLTLQRDSVFSYYKSLKTCPELMLNNIDLTLRH